jgi:hypothetical protein
MNIKTIAAAMLLTAIPATAGTPVPSLTTPTPMATTESGWHWRIGLDAWVQALEGDITLRGRNAEVDLSMDDVLDNLDFAAIQVLLPGGRRCRWLRGVLRLHLAGHGDVWLPRL